MDVITVVCTVICALWAVKPWRAIPWIKRRFQCWRAADDDFDLEAQGTYYLG